MRSTERRTEFTDRSHGIHRRDERDPPTGRWEPPNDKRDLPRDKQYPPKDDRSERDPQRDERDSPTGRTGSIGGFRGSRSSSGRIPFGSRWISFVPSVDPFCLSVEPVHPDDGSRSSVGGPCSSLRWMPFVFWRIPPRRRWILFVFRSTQFAPSANPVCRSMDPICPVGGARSSVSGPR